VKVAAQGPAPPPGLKLVKSGAGLKLVKSGESSRPRPGTPARARFACVFLLCWCAGTYLRIYRPVK